MNGERGICGYILSFNPVSAFQSLFSKKKIETLLFTDSDFSYQSIWLGPLIEGSGRSLRELISAIDLMTRVKLKIYTFLRDIKIFLFITQVISSNLK